MKYTPGKSTAKAAGRKTVPLSETLDTRLRIHIALECLLNGSGEKDDWLIVVSALNAAEGIDAYTNKGALAEVWNSAFVVMSQLNKFFNETGAFIFLQEQREVVCRAVQAHEEQLTTLSRNQYESGIRYAIRLYEMKVQHVKP